MLKKRYSQFDKEENGRENKENRIEDETSNGSTSLGKFLTKMLEDKMAFHLFLVFENKTH